jgi:hypothetical protein
MNIAMPSTLSTMAELRQLGDTTILTARGPRAVVDPEKPYASLVEAEWTREGRLEDVATIFITNAECSFRCLVCDLWKFTTERGAAPTPVAEQVESALSKLPHTDHVKLYNAGSFFDTGAIPIGDRGRIAALVKRRQTLIVECHPRLVDSACVEFAQAIAPAKLQVAMGLETVDPNLLPRLNKGMCLEDFDRATQLLTRHGIAVRAFILLGPPGHRGEQAVHWAKRSIDHAFEIGAECCVVIPVRPGNGIVDQLEREGIFARPTLAELESVIIHGLETGRGRVFADLWDIEDFFDCAQCSPSRAARLREFNLTQQPAAPAPCHCQASLCAPAKMTATPRA